MSYRIRVAKEAFKFSCAHMTVFPDGRKERLHGHNYYLELELEVRDASADRLIDFAGLKRACAELCAAWKERLLIGERTPGLVIARDDGRELEFTLCGDRYVVPRGDALLLPVDNITTEQLARHAGDVLEERLRPTWPPDTVTAMRVTVLEGPGQGATHTRKAESLRPPPKAFTPTPRKV